jgi:OOP family OmpA-OmpF porin
MPKKMLKLIPIIMLCALLVSCATTPPQATYNPLHDAATGTLVPKVDNFLVVLDASYSMSESYMGKKKLTLAQDTVSRMNRTLPPLNIKGALRTLGGGYCPFAQKTDLIYGLDNYNGPAFEQALAPVDQAGGPSPLASAITAAQTDLAQTAGPVALLVFSDGKEMDDAPVAAASALKQKFGDRLCIYTILIGNDTNGADLLNKVANTGDCGFATRADDLAGQDQMATFVEKVFFTDRPDTDGDGVYDDMDKCPNTPAAVGVDKDGCPLDSDGDGVYDYLDKCPETPAGVIVDANGCPLDSDGDGVFDYRDKCPDTPKNVAVNEQGCPLDSDRDGVYNYLDNCPNTPEGAKVNAMGCWVLAGVLFDTAKADIKASMAPVLNEVVDVLNKNKAIKVEVQGHTDSRGSKKLNQALSESRAAAVMDYLIKKGIAASRLTAEGYGFSRPMASNDTDQGRAQNRRVELKPIF